MTIETNCFRVVGYLMSICLFSPSNQVSNVRIGADWTQAFQGQGQGQAPASQRTPAIAAKSQPQPQSQASFSFDAPSYVVDHIQLCFVPSS